MTSADDSRASNGTAEIRSLGDGVLLVICELDVRIRSAVRLETLAGTPPAPLTTLRLPLANGGTRVLWAFRPPQSDRPLVLRSYTGVLAAGRLIDLQPGARFPAADLAALAAGLEATARISLVSALLGVWSSVFHLRRKSAFGRAVRKLADALAPVATPIVAECAVADGRALHRAVLPAALGDVQAVYLSSGKSVEHLPRCWHLGEARTGKRPFRIVARADFAPADRLIIVGAKGIAVCRPGRTGSLPPLVQWWMSQAATASDRLREFLVRTLAEISLAGRPASLEFQMLAPLRQRRLAGRGRSPSFAVDLALAEPAGLLVSGWLRDAEGFIQRLEAEDETGALHEVALHRFPGTPTATNSNPPTGFIGLAPGYRADTPVLQPRLFLRLISGTRHRLVPKPQPADPVARRALVLRAVPPQYLTDKILTECLAPVLGDLQGAIKARGGAPVVEQLGAPFDNPAASVVVPLYRNMQFLRAQVASFAADPSLRDVELIYVLDSPEQAGEVLHLLQGLHLLYAFPITLAVMPRNAGYAAACNAGAKLARGRILAMLNSDVIPALPGWLNRVALRLSSRVAICGPKLLFEDNSIQHGGMYFARNHLGHWLNHHFYKGMPRDFAPATVDRLVPGVTGACLVVRRDVFEAVGGFTEDYVIGDYEDSDLCLKVRRAGYEIAYVAGAELYHFERQSIRQNEDYMRGSADRYNRWLHSKRWASDMSQQMQVGTPARSAA